MVQVDLVTQSFTVLRDSCMAGNFKRILIGFCAVLIKFTWREECDSFVASIMFLSAGTIAEGAPVVPISAQLKYNVDAVCEYITKKIPVPVRDYTSEPRLIGKIPSPPETIHQNPCSVMVSWEGGVPSEWVQVSAAASCCCLLNCQCCHYHSCFLDLLTFCCCYSDPFLWCQQAWLWGRWPERRCGRRQHPERSPQGKLCSRAASATGIPGIMVCFAET